MQKIFLHRSLREFKANALRYLSLFSLVALSLFIVIAVVGSAHSLILTVNEKAKSNGLEDGQFSVFEPMKKEDVQALLSRDVDVEAQFSVDFKLKDGSVLRLMKSREKINRVHLDQGKMPTRDKEIVLERNFARDHHLVLGDRLLLHDKEFIVCGIGTSPDYDLPLEQLSDIAADGKHFGTAFVHESAYHQLVKSPDRLHSESYTYAYHLNGLPENKLKDQLKKQRISTQDVEDPFFQEMVELKTKERKNILQGMEELVEGTEKLTTGLHSLKDNSNQLNRGIRILGGALGFTPFSSSMNQLMEGGDALYQGAKDLVEGGEELSRGIKALNDQTDELVERYFPMEIENLIQFVPADKNPRIKAANSDVQINYVAGLLYGIVVLILISYVISIFALHTIEGESSQIGALYALGVKRRQLMRHYRLLPLVICFTGGVLGTVLGYSSFGFNLLSSDTMNYFSIPPVEIYLSPYLLLYGLLMPPLISFVVTGIVIKKKLTKTALSLLRRDHQVKVSQVKLKDKGFLRTFRLRQLLREKRSCLAVLGGMFISLLVLILGLNCYVLCDYVQISSKTDTQFKYMYHYKYPSEEVPEGGSGAYLKSLRRENLGFDLDVSLLGIDHKSKSYFPQIKSRGKDSISISTSVAQKYKLKAGDELVLYDRVAEEAYAFKVKEIVPYSVGMFCFMDLESMRQLFDMPKDYYNVVFSNKKLDIDQGRLYDVTTKEDIVKNSEIFIQLTWPLVMTMVFCSTFLFVMVMYQMTKVMVDRASFSISLLKIFGYRQKEIGQLFLGGNFILIALGALVLLPLAKLVTDAVYPLLVANVACGVDLRWPLWLYVLVYGGILFSFLLVRWFLLQRIAKKVPAEILRECE